MEILALFGLSVGFIAGFFGVGGGTVLVPLLMLTGYTIKEAVGISIVQMLFSSIFGSFLNYKKGNLEIKIVLFIAMGGFVGAFLSAYWVSYVDDKILEYLFFAFALLSTIKLFMSKPTVHTPRKISPFILIGFGMILGTFAISVGVGGAILLTPFLVSYLGYELKKGINASLFFVFFSSLAGFISWSMQGTILLKEGLVVGISSLVGVYISVLVGQKVNAKLHKQLLFLLDFSILVMITKKIFF